MIRKVLIRTIATIFMASGLWKIGVAILPFFVPSESNSVNWFLLIFGILFFRAGDNLFRLKEFGGKLVLVLLSLQVILLISSLSLPSVQGGFSFAIDFLGKPFLQSGNYFLYILVVAVGLLILLGTLVFLLNRKVRAIFERPNSKVTTAETLP